MRKSFRLSRPRRPPEILPECREHYEDIYRERRAAKREAKRQRKAVLNPGPAHELGMSAVLRELEQFNAARRAEGLPVVTYGRYVAMRDGKIPKRDRL